VPANGRWDLIRRLKVNFLEPSGPLQACNGTALPLPLLNIPETRLLTPSILVYISNVYLIKLHYTFYIMYCQYLYLSFTAFILLLPSAAICLIYFPITLYFIYKFTHIF